jgi:hypothetical protein
MKHLLPIVFIIVILVAFFGGVGLAFAYDNDAWLILTAIAFALIWAG